MIQIPLKLPPGINFVVQKDHSITIHVNPLDVLKLRNRLLEIASDMANIALQSKLQERAVEAARQKIPENRMEKLDREIAILEKAANGQA